MKQANLTPNQLFSCATILGYCTREIREILTDHPEDCWMRESVRIFLEMAGTSLIEFETEPPRDLPLPL